MRLAHRFALANDLVTADCVEATEFPDLVGKYGIHAVPKTVVNDMDAIEGSLPEEFFLDRILATLEPATSPDS